MNILSLQLTQQTDDVFISSTLMAAAITHICTLSSCGSMTKLPECFISNQVT